MRIPVPRMIALAALVGLSLPACATSSADREERAGEPTRDSRFITAEEIAESGADNAWEAIRTTAGFDMKEDARGQPVQMSSRGRGSIFIDDRPVVVVDGMRVMDLQLLYSIDARTIASIEIVNGVQGTLRYGTGSGGGAIVVTTRAR